MTKQDVLNILNNNRDYFLNYTAEITGYDTSTSEDIVQDFYERMMKTINNATEKWANGFSNEKSVLGFLFKTLGWVINDFHRNRKRRSTAVDIVNIDPDSPEEVDDKIIQPSKGAEINFDTKSDLRKAVNRLPEEYRRVVYLFYFADMSIPEVAEKLHIPKGTVKSRLFRALSILMNDPDVKKHRLKGESILEDFRIKFLAECILLESYTDWRVGWLSPEGFFVPCEIGEHEIVAARIIHDNYPDLKVSRLKSSSDMLLLRGYMLLDIEGGNGLYVYAHRFDDDKKNTLLDYINRNHYDLSAPLLISQEDGVVYDGLIGEYIRESEDSYVEEQIGAVGTGDMYDPAGQFKNVYTAFQGSVQGADAGDSEWEIRYVLLDNPGEELYHRMTASTMDKARDMFSDFMGRKGVTNYKILSVVQVN